MHKGNEGAAHRWKNTSSYRPIHKWIENAGETASETTSKQNLPLHFFSLTSSFLNIIFLNSLRWWLECTYKRLIISTEKKIQPMGMSLVLHVYWTKGIWPRWILSDRYEWLVKRSNLKIASIWTKTYYIVLKCENCRFCLVKKKVSSSLHFCKNIPKSGRIIEDEGVGDYRRK